MAPYSARCEYFVFRYVPNPIKEEFVNIGVAVLGSKGAISVKFTKDWSRVKRLDPAADIEMLKAFAAEASVRLTSPVDCEALLRWMEESFSNAIQLSPRKALVTDDPATESQRLAEMYL